MMCSLPVNVITFGNCGYRWNLCQPWHIIFTIMFITNRAIKLFITNTTIKLLLQKIINYLHCCWSGGSMFSKKLKVRIKNCFFFWRAGWDIKLTWNDQVNHISLKLFEHMCGANPLSVNPAHFLILTAFFVPTMVRCCWKRCHCLVSMKSSMTVCPIWLQT